LSTRSGSFAGSERDTTAPARVVDALAARAGRLDVLVNNAGMMQEARIEEMLSETAGEGRRPKALSYRASQNILTAVALPRRPTDA